MMPAEISRLIELHLPSSSDQSSADIKRTQAASAEK
jgi:hypothetical protein